MSRMLRQMISCHWTAKRIQRYLDADPSAPLTPGEVTRLEEHVAACERCREVLGQHRLLHRALSLWTGTRPVDQAAIDRMRSVLEDLTEGRQA
ncbi:zf-HC2 domain-containing protein [Nocardioides panacisoli]|uniref:zf-HC2 domain-containing protein n=1 Tax=Nocardioides panacisoli TaxID=627624 RepID=UPI001C6311BB|nr:zf-HC2 domain-containing protein [Nocardioides panacisoli]QYJ04161.1 zf-HC2 domain-containing protein [Nocardioides panacisoli]